MNDQDPQLTGFHHLTAITAKASLNYGFYTGTLGMRLVKKTVNQDDVSAYHLFYADGKGTPGTDLTFFDWPAASERRGTNSIVRIGMRVPAGNSLEWWGSRFEEMGVRFAQPVERGGRLTMDFEDPEGQRLCLVEDAEPGESTPWEKSPVPPEHQVRGLGPITLSVRQSDATNRILTDLLLMRVGEGFKDPETGLPTKVFTMGRGGPGAELHIRVEPDQPVARPGAGGVHHVAFRVPDSKQHALWNNRLREFRIPSSGPIDRFYFRSLYFQEPNGILFELATDGPGFTVDESMENLGEGLALPPFLESRREEIEAGLKPLR